MTGGMVAVMVLATRWLGSSTLTTENGWLENAQSLLLLAAVICGGLASVHADIRMWRCIAVVLAAVAAVGFARELQTSSQELPNIWFAIPRWAKRVTYAVAILAAIGGTLVMFFRERSTMFRHLGPRFIWPGVLFMTCFVVAKLFERKHLVFMEEAVEVFAYSLLLLINVWILKTTHGDPSSVASS